MSTSRARREPDFNEEEEFMRRFFLMAGLVTIVFLAVYGRPAVVSASQVCNATCSSGSSLSCNVASGTCTSSGTTVTCCGQTLNCVAIDAYNACRNNCDNRYDTCVNGCTVRDPCLTNCNTAQRACWTRCGARPTTSLSC
jgi:hypothetical protein